MLNVLNYIFSAFYAIYFLLVILIFHPIQVIAYNIFGTKAHRKTVNALNFFLLYGLYIVGSRIKYDQHHPLPTDRPIIFVANHQSMFDIIGIYWFLRKYNPIFVSKIELAKGIPSISYNLRKSNAALINRKDRKQAITEIAKLGSLIHQNFDFSVVIFPEGTRSRKGLRRFATGGLSILLKKSPDSVIVPVVINGTGRMDANKMYPLNMFNELSWQTLKPIEPDLKRVETVLDECREQITTILDKSLEKTNLE